MARRGRRRRNRRGAPLPRRDARAIHQLTTGNGFVPSPSASRFVETPWYPLVVTMTTISRLALGSTLITLKNVVDAVNSQLGFDTTYTMQLRIDKAKVWMSPADQAASTTFSAGRGIMTDEWRLSITPFAVMNMSPSGAYSEYARGGTPISYPRVGFRWPRNMQSVPIVVNSTTTSLPIFNYGWKTGLQDITTGALLSFVIHVHVLWRAGSISGPNVNMKYQYANDWCHDDTIEPCDGKTNWPDEATSDFCVIPQRSTVPNPTPPGRRTSVRSQ